MSTCASSMPILKANNVFIASFTGICRVKKALAKPSPCMSPNKNINTNLE